MTLPATPTIFFDGCCPLCNFVVRMIYRLDRKAVLQFAPIDSKPGNAALDRHPFLKHIDSAFLVEYGANSERVYTESQVVTRLADYVGWPEKIFFMPFKIIPRWVADPLYRFIAKNRTKVFGRYRICPHIPASMKDRILTT